MINDNNYDKLSSPDRKDNGDGIALQVKNIDDLLRDALKLHQDGNLAESSKLLSDDIGETTETC